MKEGGQKGDHHPAGLQQQAHMVAQLHPGLHGLLVGHAGSLLNRQTQEDEAEKRHRHAARGAQKDAVGEGHHPQQVQKQKSGQLHGHKAQGTDGHSFYFFLRCGL